jgi:hypothetical protein
MIALFIISFIVISIIVGNAPDSGMVEMSKKDYEATLQKLQELDKENQQLKNQLKHEGIRTH